ncbi:MAG: hypothetical protein GQ564_12060 [Bacteroidales bacterium]|nr:hypothetical protein [Bacteroidales bacterium]
MKRILKILIYSSIIALLVYLYNIDFLVFRDINLNYYYLIISIVLLFSGFLFSAISWKVALKLHGVNISKRMAIVSHGLPVFTKYIPGRIWTIIGRAGMVKEGNLSMKKLSFISLKEQLVYLCLGFIISIYPILRTEKIKEYSLVILLFTFFMFFSLFSKSLQKWLEKIWNRLFKKEINLPVINIKEFFELTWFILFYWLLWTFGFYFLLLSVFETVPIYYAFAFPLSISLGLVSLIFPGGIGIREGVITLFLISNGVSPELAISFSLLSRLWFLIGEVAMFFTALVLKRKIVTNQCYLN